ncbi:hypothetical protein ACFE04_012433 [Oxalis oulophora]
MNLSKASKFAAVLLVWLCWSSTTLIQAQSITHPDEISALRDIRKNLVDPNKNLSSWNRGDPCTSNWTGVLCFNKTMDDGYLHVWHLQLLNLSLSGTLSPKLGNFSYLKIMDFMWNSIGGSIPKEIGNIKTLELLLLNGNKLTGSLPDELGYLPNLDRIQIDQNQISGLLPASFANLNKTRHFHMNNNSISGQIPHQLSRLPKLVHFLLDNNNLSGTLPPELSQMPNLLILQLDNNHFDDATIPDTYGTMYKLLKLDLSFNQLSGPAPANKLAVNITTINLSNNSLTGAIPANFSGLPRLQILSIANNNLNGSVPSSIWQNKTLNSTERFVLDLENNMLTNVSGSYDLPNNVTVRLQGNPLCSSSNFLEFCGLQTEDEEEIDTDQTNSTSGCPSCPHNYEYSPNSPDLCFCAAPLMVKYRLKSPGFKDFRPYKSLFEDYLSTGLELNLSQLYIELFEWQSGPRLKMDLKLYPVYDATRNDSNAFNDSEVERIMSMFTGWTIPDNDIFGPYELLRFTLSGVYETDDNNTSKSGISKGALIGIILGSIAAAVALSTCTTLLILTVLRPKYYRAVSNRTRASKSMIKIDGVRSFTYAEVASATNNFSISNQVGQGGYGKVYKGILADGTIVAIKRAQEGSLQGEREFLTEIQLLSRLHHRNLVSLIGYCEEEGEQMLVYEFISEGTLREHLAEGDLPTHVSTVVKGTPGYLDPEYFLTHKLTDKSDVYSLGVVFLELLTGMQPISHGKNIVRQVNAAHEASMVFSIIDEKMGSYNSECIERFLSLALKCCQDETESRPSMGEVVHELENIWDMMPESETKMSASVKYQYGKEVEMSPQSSSYTQPYYVSSDVSGSELVSGVVPTITPR